MDESFGLKSDGLVRMEKLAESITRQSVVLCGISGSGKTTLAKMLEHRGYHRLSMDACVRQMYGETFMSCSAERQRELTAKAEKELAERLKMLLKEGKRVVIDGCLCKKSKRDLFRDASLAVGVNPMLVYVHAPFEDSLARLSKRTGQSEDDIPVEEEMLRRFFKGFEKPCPDEDAHVFENPD